jgi:peptidyl-prolyl cis-trans isomerase B (cyclophilin B)
VASSKSRQRDLARAKYHRQMARKAAAERRRRQIWASVAAFFAVVLIGAGGAWAFGAFDKDSSPTASDFCYWTNKPANGDPNLKDVGLPPSKAADIPQDGTRNMNITFPGGLVEVQLNLRSAPCTAASFAYLASKNFFDNTKCHRLLDSGAFVLQCGDPSGTGSGGPTYSFGDENLPDKPAPPTASPGPSDPPTSETVIYPKGTVAMANNGPNTNSSQFFIVYGDSPFPPNYTRFGTVTKGLEVVEAIAKAGTVDNGQGEKSKPTNDVFIQSLTVTEVQSAPAVPPATPSTPPGSAVPSATPAATPTASASAPTS